MKILQVTPRYPPRTGGVETHVKEISERLVQRGHEVVVHTADAGDDVEKTEVLEGVEVHRHRGFAPGGAFHIAPGIVSAVRGSGADVLHAHNYHSLPVLFAALGLTEEKFVVNPHYHGSSASGFRDRLLSLYRPLGRWAVREADRVIAVSEWEREQLQADFGVEATVIPNGVDVARFADAEPESRDRPYLLTVGRLEEYKGVQHLVRAMTELVDFDLLVAGSGPYSAELEQLTREVGVDDRVEFLGYVEEPCLPSLYAGAAAYVSLSEFEAYGMTVAEAVAAGTPCVVRETGALVDWVELEGCIGVSDVYPERIADTVRSVQGTTPDSSQLRTWKEVTDRVESEYNSVLSLSRGG